MLNRNGRRWLFQCERFIGSSCILVKNIILRAEKCSQRLRGKNRHSFVGEEEETGGIEVDLGGAGSSSTRSGDDRQRGKQFLDKEADGQVPLSRLTSSN